MRVLATLNRSFAVWRLLAWALCAAVPWVLPLLDQQQPHAETYDRLWLLAALASPFAAANAVWWLVVLLAGRKAGIWIQSGRIHAPLWRSQAIAAIASIELSKGNPRVLFRSTLKFGMFFDLKERVSIKFKDGTAWSYSTNFFRESPEEITVLAERLEMTKLVDGTP